MRHEVFDLNWNKKRDGHSYVRFLIFVLTSNDTFILGKQKSATVPT